MIPLTEVRASEGSASMEIKPVDSSRLEDWRGDRRDEGELERGLGEIEEAEQRTLIGVNREVGGEEDEGSMEQGSRG